MRRPAHRPLQYTQAISVDQGPRKYEWLIWRSGIQQTSQGDLRMVTEWANLPFIVRNPCLNSADVQTAPSDLSGGLRYVSIEPFRGG